MTEIEAIQEQIRSLKSWVDNEIRYLVARISMLEDNQLLGKPHTTEVESCTT
jgi:hypothetical protein